MTQKGVKVLLRLFFTALYEGFGLHLLGQTGFSFFVVNVSW
jgi:hypothetical protein